MFLECVVSAPPHVYSHASYWIGVRMTVYQTLWDQLPVSQLL